MGTLIYILVFFTPSIVESVQDPARAWIPPAPDVRDLECEAGPEDLARREAPDEVEPPAYRQDYLERRAVICRERLLPHAARPARDDAVLNRLRHHAQEAAGRVKALGPGERTWLVEVNYPDVRVAHKLAFATKTALLDLGLRVTDRAPALAAADLEVLSTLPPEKGYPLACERMHAAGGLRAGDGLVMLASLHPRETALHTGLCVDGAWRWLP
ncbi:MAG: hypothetical protein KC613_19575 [Myxococcales bacterium]|nr:hypothetical protein [Myxococcales bacterium]MCB9521800.1 hypothetical protein [Myxococcales bacterium]